MIQRAWGLVRFLLSTFLVGGVRIYQVAVRPVLPPLCRFHPSCSEYMIEAVHKYGPLSGACRGAWRICRCHPFSRGGYDPP
jgi:putative membrane protein insertion efficiency factor